MKHSRSKLVTGLAAILLAGTWGVHALHAQQPGFKRVELQKQELSVPGREGVMVRVDFAPAGAAGKRTHPGEELSYVLEGQLVLAHPTTLSPRAPAQVEGTSRPRAPLARDRGP